MTQRRVEVDGQVYEVDPQPVRSSLSDAEPSLWGFQVLVRRDGEVVGVKTCFVGRVGVQVRAPEALTGTIEDLAPVLYELALEKVLPRVEAGETGDEILFA